ncbi:hypothetical protein Shal_4057 [Shewanella halifaxensis HAW-EB4]|uniref:Uncharacterized protein n=1 Tax=Shewanella halifaxensis (strain HAW-EB4) TaxID=458817 RepID=B0TKL1_SHEHH|nr:hypothetical protein [Shewanella halifaxensis]ABZ78597.1 hypothetical protein Shal_4057 [Shewanella halifaxensis HAW-EB4]
MKIGTEENPLVATLDKVARPLLEAALRDNSFEFKDEHTYGIELFLNNVAGNEHLSKMAIRIAIFFHNYFLSDDAERSTDYEDGEVFMTTDPNSRTLINGHEDYIDNEFYVRYAGSTIGFPIPLPNLVSLLAESNILISSSNLMKTLKELHEFNYLTLSPPPNYPKSKNRTPWRHIRLYKGMIEKPLYYHIKSKADLEGSTSSN